jgi:hypothetical protein
MSEPTYDDLKREAEAHWREVQYTRAKRQSQIEQIIADASDVRDAPPIGTLYTHPLLTCVCGGLAFTVRRYGCVNGVRDKAEFSCQRCGMTRTWDWVTASWLS